MARYRTYIAGNNKIIVISKYAGRDVKGIAKCSPDDTFSMEKGEQLAKLRCDEKIAIKRLARAQAAYAAATEEFKKAKAKVDAMANYVDDASRQFYTAEAELCDMELQLQ